MYGLNGINICLVLFDLLLISFDLSIIYRLGISLLLFLLILLGICLLARDLVLETACKFLHVSLLCIVDSGARNAECRPGASGSTDALSYALCSKAGTYAGLGKIKLYARKDRDAFPEIKTHIKTSVQKTLTLLYYSC